MPFRAGTSSRWFAPRLVRELRRNAQRTYLTPPALTPSSVTRASFDFGALDEYCGLAQFERRARAGRLHHPGAVLEASGCRCMWPPAGPASLPPPRRRLFWRPALQAHSARQVQRGALAATSLTVETIYASQGRCWRCSCCRHRQGGARQFVMFALRCGWGDQRRVHPHPSRATLMSTLPGGTDACYRPCVHRRPMNTLTWFACCGRSSAEVLRLPGPRCTLEARRDRAPAEKDQLINELEEAPQFRTKTRRHQSQAQHRQVTCS